MSYRFSVRLFTVLLVVTALFVVLTSLALPPVVASHFGVTGTANGFMPRSVYILFMLVFTVVLPLVMVVSLDQTLRHTHARINLPHREYWLAPERRDETIQFLQAHSIGFSTLLLVFLGFVHGLVVQANLQQPVRLSSGWFVGGLLVFLVAVALWTGRLLTRFSRRS